MQLNLNELTVETFLRDYWQQKPLVIRQGFSNFKDILSPDELAGLAIDETIESRLVYQKQVGNKKEWQAEFGPFESYEHLGDKDWSLIVQAVNNWVPDIQPLIECFDFIPRWRFDDVMVSFAAPGGGVGPHIDLYDVFICQGSGSRHWRVGDKGPHKEYAAHPALLHTEPYEAIIDIELQTGDILYLPPGFPHDGISLENSMSFSVGYRTASAKDNHSALADYLIDNNLGQQQIEDPQRPISQHSGLVDNEDLARIKKQLLENLDDRLISQFSGTVLTQSKCELDLPEEALGFDTDSFLQTLQQQDLTRLGGLRCLYFEQTVELGVLFINGEQVNLGEELSSVIPLLCDGQTLSYNHLKDWVGNQQLVTQLTEWLNKGYWYFEEE